jgi:hypothetical protein
VRVGVLGDGHPMCFQAAVAMHGFKANAVANAQGSSTDFFSVIAVASFRIPDDAGMVNEDVDTIVSGYETVLLGKRVQPNATKPCFRSHFDKWLGADQNGGQRRSGLVHSPFSKDEWEAFGLFYLWEVI